jgi:hypothetical protein
MSEKQIINKLVEHNTFEYNLHKASEEFQELSLVLTQKLLKPNKVNDQEIIDEIGDCIIRLEVLKKIYNSVAIQERVNFKLNKFEEYLKKYKNV